MLPQSLSDLPAERASHLYRHIPIAQPTGSSGAGLWRHTRVARLALVGVLQPGKGQKVALCAVQQLENQGHAVELLLAGTGRPDFQSEIQALIDELGIADRVSCVGHVADPYPVIAGRTSS